MGMGNVIINEEAVEVVLVVDLHCFVHIYITGIDELLPEVWNFAGDIAEVHVEDFFP